MYTLGCFICPAAVVLEAKHADSYRSGHTHVCFPLLQISILYIYWSLDVVKPNHDEKQAILRQDESSKVSQRAVLCQIKPRVTVP